MLIIGAQHTFEVVAGSVKYKCHSPQHDYQKCSSCFARATVFAIKKIIGKRSEPLSGHVNGSSRYIYMYVRQKIIIVHALNQLLSNNRLILILISKNNLTISYYSMEPPKAEKRKKETEKEIRTRLDERNACAPPTACHTQYKEIV